MLRQDKKTNELSLFCQRCHDQLSSIEEYIMHKKNFHHVRVIDTINSLKQIGMDEPEVFDKLLKKFPKEKYTKEYLAWAKQEADRQIKKK